jgi:hypothetical protein
MSYLEPDEFEKAFLRTRELLEETSLDAQIEFLTLSMDFQELHPVYGAILKSLKQLKSMLPEQPETVVPERDTYDPTLGKCTGKCKIMGVGLSQCTECGWDETHSLN